MYIPSRGTFQVFQIVSASITIRETFWWKIVARGCGCEDIHDTKIWSTLIHLTVVYTIMIHILNICMGGCQLFVYFLFYFSPCTSCIVHVHVLYQIVNKEWYYYYSMQSGNTPIPLQQECNKNVLRTWNVKIRSEVCRKFHFFPKLGLTTRQTYERREILVRMYWDSSENYRNAKRHYYDSSTNHTNSKQM